jgi:hypothetical protein
LVLSLCSSPRALAANQKPLAAVVIGGLTSSTLLTFILPTLYRVFERKAAVPKSNVSLSHPPPRNCEICASENDTGHSAHRLDAGLSACSWIYPRSRYSLLPVFLVSTLGASVMTVGLIEGAKATLLPRFFGRLSDFFAVERTHPPGLWNDGPDQATVPAGNVRGNGFAAFQTASAKAFVARRVTLVVDVAPP